MDEGHKTLCGPGCAVDVAVLEAEPPVLLSLAFSVLLLFVLSWSSMAVP